MSHRLFDILPTIIGSIGQDCFYHHVLTSIQTLAPISNIRIVSYSKVKPPFFLDDYPLSDFDKFYCQQAYLLDPVYDEIYGHETKEWVTLDSLTNDSFHNSVYYDRFYQQLGWQNESNFVVETQDNRKVCIVYSTEDNPKSSYQALECYFKAVKAAIQRHEVFSQQRCCRRAAASSQMPDVSRLDRHSLTKREKEIVTLILQGLTSVDIADKCFVSEGTVKNHRKNIYRKLSIKSQAELFHQFIQ
ncbi:response regulator transcription factor [Marinomonas algarum]|uniref:LuxR C-terminal-related transcriptional regulator n=1 Tax=Marinomonas algarum TaxID=2883105 RepID=A0A9X1IKL9_9GAMM|nr:LuxR C-terminal-related transcriptional regulator [Marinomonas algarum]MCB5160995.1 LuxR C-terminal-related transcriptional regulator [Marinomonas algarum]